MSARCRPGRSLTGSPIKIGLISTLSGAQASAGNQGAVVAPAWAKWINAHGGINGHPVQIFSEDDGSDPVKAQAAEKKLVDDDNVVATRGRHGHLDRRLRQ